MYAGDVVLLELNEAIEFNEVVASSCLSDEPVDSNKESCVTVSWLHDKGKYFTVFHWNSN